MSFVTLLRHDRRGSPALEFALALPILLTALGGMTDLGLIWRARGQLAEAVDAGAQYAVLTGTTVTAANVEAAICAANTISTSCGTSGPVVTVLASAPSCGCVSSTSPTTLTLTTCGATCTGGGTAAGTYVTLSATYTYNPMLSLYSKMLTTTFTEKATVRLQ